VRKNELTKPKQCRPAEEAEARRIRTANTALTSCGPLLLISGEKTVRPKSKSPSGGFRVAAGSLHAAPSPSSDRRVHGYGHSFLFAWN